MFVAVAILVVGIFRGGLVGHALGNRGVAWQPCLVMVRGGIWAIEFKDSANILLFHRLLPVLCSHSAPSQAILNSYAPPKDMFGRLTMTPAIQKACNTVH